MKKFLVTLFIFIVPLMAISEEQKQILLQTVDIEGELSMISANVSAERHQEALADLRILLQITENARAYFMYGMVNNQIERPKLTVKAFQKTLPFGDVNPGMISEMGDYFSKKNMTDHAIQMYEKGVELFPQNLGLYSRLGELYFNAQQYNKNIMMFEDLIKRAPELINPVSYYLGLSYYAIEKDALALKNFTDAADAGMEHPDLFLKLGDLNAQENNYREAVKYYQLAEGLGVTEPQLYNNLGYSFLKLGENENSLDYLIKARDAGYQSEVFYKNFASIAFILKSYDELVRTLEPVYDNMEDKTETAYYMARSYDVMGDREKALYYYQQSLDQGYNENIEYINERIEVLAE
jgi:tetratricopeptide (TPR) repeat protein